MENPGAFVQWMQSQDEQLFELSRRIDAANADIPPAFRNSRAVLQERERPPTLEEMHHGRGEVWRILNDCHKHLETLPGLVDWVDMWMEMRTRNGN